MKIGSSNSILNFGTTKLGVVVPCYNEEKRLPTAVFDSFAKTHPAHSFLFVNDGSKDKTADVLKELVRRNTNIDILDLPKNVGKAEGVRLGTLLATKFNPDYVGFLDADLATPLEELSGFIKIAEEKKPDIVMGLRLKRLGANIERKASRHYLGRVFATAASNLLGVGVYDTQCGAKIFKNELVSELFGEKFVSRWFFDIEILKRYIKKFGAQRALTHIHEHPLQTWIDVGGSKLKPKDFIKAPLELLKIARHYK